MLRDAAVLALIVAFLGTAECAANPWLKEEGALEVISSATISEQPTGLGAGTTAQSSTNLHAEYGADAHATVIADALVQQYSFSGVSRTSFDNARIGTRFALFRWDNSLVSTEWLAGVAGVRESASPYSPLSLHATAEARVMFGQGFAFLRRHAFAGIEGGWRWRPGPPADEAVLDTIIGMEPWPNALIMLQSFSIYGLSGASGAYSRYDLSKLQFSVAQGLGPRLSLQIGLLHQIAGRESGSTGAVVGIWWRLRPGLPF